MPVETTIYTTLIGDDEPIEEIPAEIINYGYRLNRPGTLSFSLSLDHPFCRRSVVGPGSHEAVVVRNRTVVWRGPIWTATETDEKSSRKVEFGAEGLFSYMSKAHVTTTLDYRGGEDMATIARTLIDHHQAKTGVELIDTSGTETSRQADRFYPFWERTNIAEAIEGLSNSNIQNGFDFTVDPATRRFIVHYPRQGARFPDLIWEDGIRSFTRGIDAKSQASQVLGVGEGENEKTLLRQQQDSVAVAEFGLTNKVITHKDVKRAETLLDHVRRELAATRFPAETVDVSVGTDTFNPFSVGLGSEGTLRYPSSYEPVNTVRRLVGFDIKWESGDERADLFLGPVFT